MHNSEQQHPYHLVDLSPWPIMMAFSLLLLTSGGVMSMHGATYGHYVLGVGFASVLYVAFQWWKDVIVEGRVGHHHTEAVRLGLKIGMAVFIVSEIMFFFGFFWSFFKAWLFPVGNLDGGIWPISEGVWPGTKTFDPWDIPFINTLILLLSGTTVTWAHHAVLHNNQRDTVRGLGLTILLGLCFTSLQAYEYMHAGFGIKDGIYATNFYLATGFHGLHVIIGTIFLTICFFRARKGHFLAPNGHLGFEFATWYWHFVDVVWILLFAFLYVFAS